MQMVDVPELAPWVPIPPALTMFVILYPDSLKEEIIEILDSVGVPGFTEVERVVGRGKRGRHFDNQIWPGADGMIYAVVAPRLSGTLQRALEEYNCRIELQSKGLFGVHVFTWGCDQVI